MRLLKIVLVLCITVLFVAGLFQGLVSAGGAKPMALSPQQDVVADGGAPVPDPWLAADGGAPVPDPWLVADGGAPVPDPWSQIAA
jgi:hypothetical protein